MSNFQKPPVIEIDENSKKLLAGATTSGITILCGRNNSGKSYLLRSLFNDIGIDAFYLGPSRYNNFTIFDQIAPISKNKKSRYDEVHSHIHGSGRNADNIPLNLGEAIARLTDVKRKELLSLLDKLLGSKTKLEHTIPDNSMSQQYVNVDGHNISYTSSGFRLVTTLLTSLFNEDSSHFLIDEPELGLSPEIQGILAEFLFDEARRSAYFPHIKSIVIATHSPIFLDRKQIGNNYIVNKQDDKITVSNLSTLQDLNSLQFFLLNQNNQD